MGRPIAKIDPARLIPIWTSYEGFVDANDYDFLNFEPSLYLREQLQSIVVHTHIVLPQTT